VTSVVELVLESFSEKFMQHNDMQENIKRQDHQIVDFHERYGAGDRNNCCIWGRHR